MLNGWAEVKGGELYITYEIPKIVEAQGEAVWGRTWFQPFTLDGKNIYQKNQIQWGWVDEKGDWTRNSRDGYPGYEWIGDFRTENFYHVRSDFPPRL